MAEKSLCISYANYRVYERFNLSGLVAEVSEYMAAFIEP